MIMDDFLGMLDRLNEISIAVKESCDRLARILKNGN